MSENIIQDYFDKQIKIDYASMDIDEILSDKDIFDAWLGLFANYTYQVSNGGHFQYVDNGYHSSHQSGCLDKVHHDDDLHQKLIQLTAKLNNILHSELLSTLQSILSEMVLELDLDEGDDVTCHHCGGDCVVNEWDDDEEEDIQVDCTECGGEGEYYEDNPNFQDLTDDTKTLLQALDDRHDEISVHIIDEIEEFIKSSNDLTT